jgi:hypothetical protein
MSTVTTQIPARMNRLPWSRWPWLVVLGLGHAQREGRIRRVSRRRWEAVPR